MLGCVGGSGSEVISKSAGEAEGVGAAGVAFRAVLAPERGVPAPPGKARVTVAGVVVGVGVGVGVAAEVEFCEQPLSPTLVANRHKLL